MFLNFLIDSFEHNELQEDDKNIMAQNQVALIAVCELVNVPISSRDNTSIENNNYDYDNSNNNNNNIPPIIIGTTHLKSSKSRTGERYRYRGVNQILSQINQIYNSFSRGY